VYGPVRLADGSLEARISVVRWFERERWPVLFSGPAWYPSFARE